MKAILRTIVCLAALTGAVLLATGTRSTAHAAAGMMAAVAPEAGHDSELRAAVRHAKAKLPCPLCPKQSKTKQCSTVPCAPASASIEGSLPIAFSLDGSSCLPLRDDCSGNGIELEPDPPPPRN